MTQLFIDLDQTLADFDSHYKAVFGVAPCKILDNVDWEAVREVPGFYADMPPMPDFQALWDRVAPHNPIILTGVPSAVPEAAANKLAWVDKHLGTRFQMIACKSADKYLHGKPGDILIDDWEKYKHYWVEMGGVWVTHTSAVSTLEVLETLGYVEYRKAKFEFLGAKR